MHLGRTILMVSVAMSCLFSARADPLNFIVGEFTFSRPPAWRWEELISQSKASAQLRIPDEKSDREAQVLISSSRATRDDVVAKWKIYFVEPPVVVHKVTSKKINKLPVTYVTVEGTYRIKGALKTGYALLGIVIETDKGNVFGRLIGPKSMVEQSGPQFKKMIEDALKEE